MKITKEKDKKILICFLKDGLKILKPYFLRNFLNGVSENFNTNERRSELTMNTKKSKMLGKQIRKKNYYKIYDKTLEKTRIHLIFRNSV